MLTLVFSAFVTVYLLVPEAIFRSIFGLFIPSRSFLLTGVEKAYRAALITVLPFAAALILTWYVPGARAWPFPIARSADTAQQRRVDYKTVWTGFYSDSEYVRLGDQFWHAATRCSRRQGRLVSWYLAFVALEALGSGLLASNYTKLKNRILKWTSDKFLTPYISQWHPFFTTPGKLVKVDILCGDTLYDGEVADYFLKEGELSGLLVRNPRRFDRQPYLKAKDEGKQPEPKNYWRSIPSRNLYFFADKISNINLTYVTKSDTVSDTRAVERFLAEEIPLGKGVGELKISVKEPEPPKSKQ